MKIILVTEEYDELNNGTTMTTYRFAKMLERRGHEVHVVGSGKMVEEKYRAPEQYYPIATPVAKMQGVGFGKPDPELFRRAFEGADVIHFLLPMYFEQKALQVAKEMKIPVSAAFHLQPENITYNIHMPWEFLSRGIYHFFNHTFYRNFDHIHCPSKFIADQLRKNGYRATLHVISNGVGEAFVPGAEKRSNDTFNILMVGRLAEEKRQNILIDAVAQSKYADKIQLYLAGRGPCKKALEKQGRKLKNRPVFGFYSEQDLIRLIHSCDLYVHASFIEIEAIACMEAFACGLVPVICNSPKSATVQFAQHPQSLFQPDNPKDLASKIDYWIEHREERLIFSTKYAQFGNQYRVSRSVMEVENMFHQVIDDFHEKQNTCKT